MDPNPNFRDSTSTTGSAWPSLPNAHPTGSPGPRSRQFSNIIDPLSSSPTLSHSSFSEGPIELPSDIQSSFEGFRTTTIPLLMVPIVIGLHGEQVKRIKQASGVALIHIHNQSMADERDVTTLKTVTVGGSRETTRAAKEMINQIVEANREWSMMTVPQILIHRIVGPEHHILRELQTLSNCYIVIRPRVGKADQTRDVYLVGPPDAQERAKNLVREFVEGRGFMSVTANKNIIIPPGMLKYVIGKGGATLERIKAETGCRIWYQNIHQNGSCRASVPINRIVLDGADEAIAAAEQAIAAIVMEAQDLEQRKKGILDTSPEPLSSSRHKLESSLSPPQGGQLAPAPTSRKLHTTVNAPVPQIFQPPQGVGHTCTSERVMQAEGHRAFKQPELYDWEPNGCRATPQAQAPTQRFVPPWGVEWGGQVVPPQQYNQVYALRHISNEPSWWGAASQSSAPATVGQSRPCSSVQPFGNPVLRKESGQSQIPQTSRATYSPYSIGRNENSVAYESVLSRGQGSPTPYVLSKIGLAPKIAQSQFSQPQPPAPVHYTQHEPPQIRTEQQPLHHAIQSPDRAGSLYTPYKGKRSRRGQRHKNAKSDSQQEVSDAMKPNENSYGNANPSMPGDGTLLRETPDATSEHQRPEVRKSSSQNRGSDPSSQQSTKTWPPFFPSEPPRGAEQLPNIVNRVTLGWDSPNLLTGSKNLQFSQMSGNPPSYTPLPSPPIGAEPEGGPGPRYPSSQSNDPQRPQYVQVSRAKAHRKSDTVANAALCKWGTSGSSQTGTGPQSPKYAHSSPNSHGTPPTTQKGSAQSVYMEAKAAEGCYTPKELDRPEGSRYGYKTTSACISPQPTQMSSVPGNEPIKFATQALPDSQPQLEEYTNGSRRNSEPLPLDHTYQHQRKSTRSRSAHPRCAEHAHLQSPATVPEVPQDQSYQQAAISRVSANRQPYRPPHLRSEASQIRQSGSTEDSNNGEYWSSSTLER